MVTSLNSNATKAIKSILAMIESETDFTPQTEHTKGEPAKLINDCLTLLDGDFSKTSAKNATEPVRTIHHLSCTGGTLIAKCIAALPNILMLNEADPLSTIPFNGDRPNFTPTDMVALLRQGDTKSSSETIIRMFAQQISFLRDENIAVGRTLVVRDHSHSHFLVGDTVPERPSVREMLHNVMPVRSIVTVRNPIDSYLSLKKHGWHKHFSPPTFEEYCHRYLAFLDKYKGVDIIRYEDFVENPEKAMKKICGTLNLNYSKRFTELFGAFQFSGDSGRSGDVIEARPRREKSKALGLTKFPDSYRELALRMEYPVAIVRQSSIG